MVIELLKLANCTKSCCLVAQADYCPGQKICTAAVRALGRPTKHQLGLLRFVWYFFATFLKHIQTPHLLTKNLPQLIFVDFSLYLSEKKFDWKLLAKTTNQSCDSIFVCVWTLLAIEKYLLFCWQRFLDVLRLIWTPIKTWVKA